MCRAQTFLLNESEVELAFFAQFKRAGQVEA